MKIIYCCLIGSLFTGCATHYGTETVAKKAVHPNSTHFVASNYEIFSKEELLTKKLTAAALDTQDRKVLERSSPRTIDRMDRGDPLTLNDVIKLSQGGVDDATIIQYMQNTASSYHLSQSQVRRLQDAGVSQRIIDFMLDSGR